MKKTIHLLVIAVLTSSLSIAQESPSFGLNYTDLGVLFSEDNTFGTSRFAALNGSMGAVGGDLSAIGVNPAGAAVFNNGEANITLTTNNYNNDISYYNTTTSNTYSKGKFEQAGGVFVFKDNHSYGGWNKINFAVNYQLTNKFDRSNIHQGNSGYGYFIIHPNDADNTYENLQDQELYNYYEGKTSKLSFTLAGEFEKKIYVGASMNFHSLDFFESSQLNEISIDDSDNTLNTTALYDNNINSDGFSLSAGIIFKPISFLRVGASIESPTWFYNITEEFFYVEEFKDNEKNIGFTNSDPIDNFFEYKLSTPGKLTLSSAIVIGKFGFINIDYTYKGYNALNLSENKYFNNVLQNTSNLNIGGEARLGNFSIRAGAGFQQSPFKDSVDIKTIDVLKTGDLYSGSIGIGARFGNSKFDIAYRATEQTNEYDFNDGIQKSAIENTGQSIETSSIKNNNSSLGITYTYIF